MSHYVIIHIGQKPIRVELTEDEFNRWKLGDFHIEIKTETTKNKNKSFGYYVFTERDY